MSTEFISARAPKGLVDAVNAHAETMGVTRSNVIIGALAAYVGFDLDKDLKEGEERRGEVFERLNFLDEVIKSMTSERGQLLNRIESLEKSLKKIELEISSKQEGRKKAVEHPTLEKVKEAHSPEIHYDTHEEGHGPMNESGICKLTKIKTSTLQRKRSKIKVGQSVIMKNKQDEEWEMTLVKSEKVGTKTKVEWTARKIN